LRLLLLIYTLSNPEKDKVTRCNVHVGQIIGYGKKSTLWGQKATTRYWFGEKAVFYSSTN
jgi:hypothetical protein